MNFMNLMTYISIIIILYKVLHACMCAQSCVTVTPRTVAHQAPLSMGLPRQEYWNRLPFSSPGDLPDPGMEPTLLASPTC